MRDVANLLLWEIIKIHNLHYRDKNLPSSLLPSEAGVYIKAFGEARSGVQAWENYDFILAAELAWNDFIDPTGEYEMSKTISKSIR